VAWSKEVTGIVGFFSTVINSLRVNFNRLFCPIKEDIPAKPLKNYFN